jgi:membrane protein
MFKSLLLKPTDEVGRWTRFLLMQVRIWRQCFRLLKANQAFTQAAALAYHTIFGIVPLAIVMLMVFQMFPAYRDLGEKVRTFTYEYFDLNVLSYPGEKASPDSEPEKIVVTDKINEVVESYLSKVSTGAITIVGVVLVIWAAVGLLTTIERTFNTIWHINVGRGFMHRIVYYSWILMFGPILLTVGIFISTEYLLKGGVESGFWAYIRPIFPFLVSVGLLFFLYSMLPNTKVNTVPALWGALVATLLWTAVKFGFRMYFKKVVMYQAVYGILGIIPLTVFWIYVIWVIVLFGLQLTYATQNLRSLDAAELARLRRSNECFLANDQTIIRIMEYILNAFEQKNEQPVTIEAVSARLDIPPDFAQRVLDQMVKSGLLFHTNEPVSGYVPSTDGTHISLSDIYDAVAQVSFAQPQKYESPKAGIVFGQVREMLSRYTLKDVLDPWQKELPVMPDDGPAEPKA